MGSKEAQLWVSGPNHGLKGRALRGTFWETDLARLTHNRDFRPPNAPRVSSPDGSARRKYVRNRNRKRSNGRTWTGRRAAWLPHQTNPNPAMHTQLLPERVRSRSAQTEPAPGRSDNFARQGVAQARPPYVKRQRGRPPVYDWSTVEWSLPTATIAASLGCTKNAVWRHRKKLPPGTVPKYSRPTIFDWSNVNWALRNVVIARGLGCTRAAVSLARRREGQLGARPSRASAKG